MSTKIKLALSSVGYLAVCWHCLHFHGAHASRQPAVTSAVAAALIAAAPPSEVDAPPSRDAAAPAPRDALVDAPLAQPPRADAAALARRELPTTFETPAALQVALDAITDGRPVTFRASGAEITAESSAVLDDVAALLQRAPRWRVEVQGHTDDAGSAVACRERGARRAALVAQALSDRGVALRRLIVLGVGSARPLADNGTEEGRLRNRRIRFFVRARP